MRLRTTRRAKKRKQQSIRVEHRPRKPRMRRDEVKAPYLSVQVRNPVTDARGRPLTPGKSSPHVRFGYEELGLDADYVRKLRHRVL